MKGKRRVQNGQSGASKRSGVSAKLHKANALIGKRKVEAALTELSDATILATTAEEKAKIASLVARSQFSLGRYDEAASQFRTANAISATGGRAQDDWLRPALGEVGALLKAQKLTDALAAANAIAENATKHEADFNAATNVSVAQLQSAGAVRVGPRPIRLNVALTAVGSLFFQEGYIEEAKEYLQRAIDRTPNGASRARQLMASILLQETNFQDAEQLARESLQMGRFQAKTLASWPILLAARAAQKKPLLEPSLYRALQISGKGNVKARAVLSLIVELRKRGDASWKSIAQESVAPAKISDHIVAFEISKILLSEMRISGDSSTKVFRRASDLLKDPVLSSKESVAIAKATVEAGLLAGLLGNSVDSISKLILQRFGSRTAAEATHAMAIGAMMAKSYELARRLLLAQVRSLKKGAEQWSKSLWALAKMESVLENHAIAAAHYLSIADEDRVPLQFRLQAFLYWLESIQKAGAQVDMTEVQNKVRRIVSDIQDYKTLLDAARQLALAGRSFKAICKLITEQGEAKALQAFGASTDSVQAVGILNHLARRQYYDLSRVPAMLEFWEALDVDKFGWLWSKDSRFWEYIALIASGYFDVDQPDAGESLLSKMLADTTVPETGRVHLLVTYANWFLDNERLSEAWPLYSRVITATPDHRLASHAYYWLAIRKLSSGDRSGAEQMALKVRVSLAPKPGLHWEWALDCKAALVLKQIYGPGRDVDTRLYKQEFVQKLSRVLDSDMKRVTQ